MKKSLFPCRPNEISPNETENTALYKKLAKLLPGSNYVSLLLRFTDMSRNVLRESLEGIYLHGSAVMGCFNPQKSDLDLILITSGTLPFEAKVNFIKNVCALNEEAPQKGIELSIVQRKFCRPFVYPTPFELHFSPAHLGPCQKDPEEYVKNMHGTDKDLAAHFMIISRYGVALFGPPVPKVFGAVPREAYLDSILLDVENALEEICHTPVYTALNLCRILAYLREDLVLSKKAGGQWGLRTLPETFGDFLQDMLLCYGSGEDTLPIADQETKKGFAEYMLAQIHKSL